MGNTLFVSGILHNTSKKSNEESPNSLLAFFLPYTMPKQNKDENRIPNNCLEKKDET